MSTDVKEMSDKDILSQIIELGFHGDQRHFDQFCEELRCGLPDGTGVALRGSVVTNERWQDGEPFDAKGKNTSDLDVTLIGDKVRECWKEDAYYIPGLHTKPLCDKAPDLAPYLEPLRSKLQQLVGRPVAFQATADFILYARDVLMGQPYFILIEPSAKAE